ncbi:hypothetical protein, partial [Xanthomonas euvesicatoria]|uniref:hypothetical protein n=1 Tax=Xanthomonas euvesicatoria TaxID=456327 RepID=UPI001B8005C0
QPDECGCCSESVDHRGVRIRLTAVHNVLFATLMRALAGRKVWASGSKTDALLGWEHACRHDA